MGSVPISTKLNFYKQNCQSKVQVRNVDQLQRDSQFQRRSLASQNGGSRGMVSMLSQSNEQMLTAIQKDQGYCQSRQNDLQSSTSLVNEKQLRQILIRSYRLLQRKTPQQINNQELSYLQSILTQITSKLQIYVLQSRLIKKFICLLMYKSFKYKSLCPEIQKKVKNLTSSFQIGNIVDQFAKFKQKTKQRGRSQSQAKRQFLQQYYNLCCQQEPTNENIQPNTEQDLPNSASQTDKQAAFRAQSIQRNNYLFNNIEKIFLPGQSCPGCTRYLYYGTIVLNLTQNRIPFCYFPSIHNFKSAESDFLKKVCSFLNSGGGLIYFDCRELKGKLLTLGTQISQEQKLSIATQIFQIVNQNLYTKIGQEPSSLINIQFVPLARPFKQKEHNHHQGELLGQLDFLERIYVGRINVSAKSDKVYFIKGQSSIKCYMEQNGSTIRLSYRNILNLQRRKIRNSSEQQRNPIKKSSQIKLYNFIDHNCQQSQSGYLFIYQLFFEEMEERQFSRYYSQMREIYDNFILRLIGIDNQEQVDQGI